MWRMQDLPYRNGAFWTGLVAGTLVGAGLGVLFAPKAGAETRHLLKDRATRARERVSASYRSASDRVGRLVARGRQVYERARSRRASPAAGEPAGAPPTETTGAAEARVA